MRMNTAAFTKSTFNHRLINLNLSRAAAYLTASQLRQQVERVFTFTLTKRAFYFTHKLEPSSPAVAGSRRNTSKNNFIRDNMYHTSLIFYPLLFFLLPLFFPFLPFFSTASSTVVTFSPASILGITPPFLDLAKETAIPCHAAFAFAISEPYSPKSFLTSLAISPTYFARLFFKASDISV